MVAVDYGARKIIGTDAERTGGTWTGLPSGFVFFTSDTLLWYYWNGTIWTVEAGAPQNIQVMPSVKNTGTYQPMAVTSGVSGFFQGNITNIAVGTGASATAAVSSTGRRFSWTTGTTINSICGARCSAILTMERDLNPTIRAKIALAAGVTTSRAFFGFTSSNAGPVSSADPLANLSGVGFWYDSAVDTEWMICQNDGSASSDITTIVNIATADANPHIFALKAVEANAKFQYSYDGGAFVDVNTKIPAAATDLGWSCYHECLAASASRTLHVYYVEAIQDP